MRTLFGPINSRRLGRSLGIDLLPFKTCSLDCIYCECGPTTTLTRDRAEFVPVVEVLMEIDAFLSLNRDVDYITFSGAGEPTLHAGIGRIIRHLKQNHPQFKVAVLTNGTRLGDPQVQADLREADLVIPSLDAATSRAFNAICQPVQGIDVEAVIEGIASFREGYAGQLLLEVFIVPGINDGDEELRALKLAALRIKPDAIQLNSLDRPAAHSASIGVPRPEQLERVREYLSPLQVQTVRKRGAGEPAPWDNPECFRSILAALGHGDANLSRLAVATGIREGDLAKTLAQMAHQTLVEVDETTGVFRRNAPNLSL